MRKWPRFRCASDRSCWQCFRCASDRFLGAQVTLHPFRIASGLKMFSGKESRNPAEPPKKKFLPKKFLVEEEGDEDSHNNYYHSYYYHNYKTKPWFLAMFSRYLGALQVASNTAKVLKVRSSKVLLMPLGTLDARNFGSGSVGVLHIQRYGCLRSSVFTLQFARRYSRYMDR